MATNYVSEGCTMQWKNSTGSAVASGDPVVVGKKQMGIALVDIANAATGSVALDGVFQLAKTTGAIAQGAPVFWDATNEYCVNAATLGCYFIGFAEVAALSADTTVDVSLEEFMAEGTRVLTLAATGNQTIAKADLMSGDLILFVPNTGAKTLALAAVADIPLSRLTVKKTDATAQAVTLDPNSSEQIAGGSTYASIDANNDIAKFVSTGAAWNLIDATIA